MPDSGQEQNNQVQIGEKTTYWLDSNDCIIKVSQSWNRFAEGNSADANTLEKNVIGKKVFSFIVGDPTRMYLVTLLQQTRILGLVVARKYRCDSPKLKRYMEMCLTPEPNRIVRLDHTLERIEPFAQPFAFHPASPPSSPTIYRCSVCARLMTGSGWVSPEEALEQKQIPADKEIAVSYMVCPACQALL